MSRPTSAPLPLRLAAEFTVIVIGVLVALAVDGLWQEWEETKRAEEALADVAEEVLDQHYTLGRVTMVNLPNQVASIDRVVRFLAVEGAPVQDTLLLLEDLEESIGRERVWLRFDRYQALVSSGDLRFLRDRLDSIPFFSAYLGGPDVLLPQVDALEGRWSQAAMEVLPYVGSAQYTPLSNYNGRRELPFEPRVDEVRLDRMVETLRERRQELYPLAQAKLNESLTNYHIIERLRRDFDSLLHDLEPWLDEPLPEGFELGRDFDRADFNSDFRRNDEVPRAEMGASYAEGVFTGSADLVTEG